MAADDAKAEARRRRRDLERRAGVADLSDADLELLISAGGVRPVIERARQDERARQILESRAPRRPDGQCDCCDRHDEYNGYGSGPLLFRCPKNCSCHD